MSLDVRVIVLCIRCSILGIPGLCEIIMVVARSFWKWQGFDVVARGRATVLEVASGCWNIPVSLTCGVAQPRTRYARLQGSTYYLI